MLEHGQIHALRTTRIIIHRCSVKEVDCVRYLSCIWMYGRAGRQRMHCTQLTDRLLCRMLGTTICISIIVEWAIYSISFQRFSSNIRHNCLVYGLVIFFFSSKSSGHTATIIGSNKFQQIALYIPSFDLSYWGLVKPGLREHGSLGPRLFQWFCNTIHSCMNGTID